LTRDYYLLTLRLVSFGTAFTILSQCV